MPWGFSLSRASFSSLWRRKQDKIELKPFPAHAHYFTQGARNGLRRILRSGRNFQNLDAPAAKADTIGERAASIEGNAHESVDCSAEVESQ